MSILVNGDTRLVVQGITGREGGFHSRAMLEYGTKIVAGVTPGKGGQTALDARVPVFDTMADAVEQSGANASCIFVPASGAPDAMLEAAEAGIGLIFCITEGIPALDMLRVYHVLRHMGIRLIGPNCPGATSPGQAKVGIIPGSIHRPGPVGLVSRSGTLTYEVVQVMTDAGIGQSTCVGIGGDPIVGTSFIDVLDMFNQDPETEAIVLIGRSGAMRRSAPRPSWSARCASRWLRSSRVERRLPGVGWATPARSYRAVQARPSRSARRWRPRASRSPIARHTSPTFCGRPESAASSPRSSSRFGDLPGARPLAGHPLVVQDAHEHRVLPRPAVPIHVSQDTLPNEPHLLVGADRPRIRR